MADTELKPDIVNKKATASVGYKAGVSVGGSDPAKFVPNINFSFERVMPDEFYLNVNADDVIVGSEIPVISKEPQIKVGDRTDKFYILPDGNLEYEIILDKKPATNVIELKIQCSQDLNFYHQPALTASELEDKGAGPWHKRPDDIVNSYAVYCNSQNNVYQTGKVAHLKRSWVRDKNQQQNWCDQLISVSKGAGTWEITIPAAIWSDEKLYPLTIGPTFGYTTAGSSEKYVGGADGAWCSKHNLSEAGDVSKLTFHGHRHWAGTTNAKALIFDDDATGGEPDTITGTGTAEAIDTSDDQTPNWEDIPFSPDVSLTSGDWWIGLVGDNYIWVSYDSGGTCREEPDTYSSYATPGNWDESVDTGTSNEMSIYATYTTSGNAYTASGNVTPSGAPSRTLEMKRSASGNI